MSKFLRRFTLCLFVLCFNSGQVTEWQPFGKELFTQFTIFSLFVLIKSFPVLVLRADFWVLIVPVPSLFMLVTLMFCMCSSIIKRVFY